MRHSSGLNTPAPLSVLLSLLLSLCLPAAAFANAAAPSQGGQAGTEPTGLEQVFILRESLNVDLRPLEEAGSHDGQLILVEAVYELENRGEERRLNLVFIFGSAFKDFRVWLDDQPVGSQPVRLKEQPPSWGVPDTTPWLDGRKLGYAGGSRSSYGARDSQSFNPVVPPGRHRLRASYSVTPSRYAASPVRYWQFAYVLAPAREWAGFGGLDVTVSAPRGWTVVTEPKLEPEGGVLKGRFDQLPADALAVTARAPVPFYYQPADYFFLLLFLLAIFASPVLIIIFAGRRGYKLRLSWLWGVGAGLLWGLLIIGTGILYAVGASYTVPRGQYSAQGYEGVFAIFGSALLAVVAFPAGLALWLLTTHLTRQKKAQLIARDGGGL
ncbi:MAG: hypothetical protein ABW250_17540 [Pyrinomonadaceae bacterium]